MNLYSNLRLTVKNNLFRLKNKNIISKTVKIKNTKNGKNVILLATGKSLSIIDLKKIKQLREKNYEIFSLGGFLASEASKEVDIDYYLLSDERTIFPEKYNLEINLKNTILKTVKLIIEKKIKLFLPTQVYEKHCFKNNEIYYFNNLADKMTTNISDITKYYGYGSISGLKALSICKYLGYDNIYFIGLDNDHWNNIKVNSSNKIFQVNRHFYDNDKVHRKNLNIDSISSLLKKSSEIFKAYEKFRKYSIINLDPDSLIDCFDKNHKLDIYK
jgi:hypothetical protein